MEEQIVHIIEKHHQVDKNGVVTKWNPKRAAQTIMALYGDVNHAAANEWCCACEADVAFMEGRIKDASESKEKAE